jgi:hypothetical protein
MEHNYALDLEFNGFTTMPPFSATSAALLAEFID